VLVPDGVSDDQALMMTDALATAWFGARNADIKPGSSVAVIGLGPIGLMAVESAFVMGAHVVYAIDPMPNAARWPKQAGAIALHPEEALERIKRRHAWQEARLRGRSGGHDATVDLRAAPGPAARHGVGDRRAAIAPLAFPLERAFAAGLTFRIGTCSVPEEWPALFPLVQSGRLKPERYISHRLPLSEGAEAYRLFEAARRGRSRWC
jgi:threonine dehydrogenase-like Zn-dependent dehydrogenase